MLSVEVPNKGVDVGKLPLKTKRGSSAIRYLRVPCLSTRNVILKLLCNNNTNNFTSLRTASFAPLAVKNFNPVQSYSLQKFNNKIEKSKKLLEFSGTLSFIKQTLKRHNFGLDWNFSTLFVSKQLVFQR